MTDEHIQPLAGTTHGPIVMYSTFEDGAPSMTPVPVAQLETSDLDDDRALATIRFISPTQSSEFYSRLAEQLHSLADSCEELAADMEDGE